MGVWYEECGTFDIPVSVHRVKRAGMINRRLALTTEIVENIHSVKAYGWEEVMETIIKNIRQ